MLIRLEERPDVERLSSPEVSVYGPVKAELEGAPIKAPARLLALPCVGHRMRAMAGDAQDGGLRAHDELGRFAEKQDARCRVRGGRPDGAMGRGASMW